MFVQNVTGYQQN